jgi:hypothetical protein
MPQPIDEPRESEIYSQDCEFLRHQDELMWGRFQTAATVQAGLLAVLFLVEPQKLGRSRPYLLLAGGLLVLALCLLSLKDYFDGQRHLDRIKAFERAHLLPKSRWKSRVKGVHLMFAACAILYIANVLMFIFRA